MNVTMWQLVSSGGLQAPSALSIVEPRPVDSPICVALEPADKIGAGYTVSETWRSLILITSRLFHKRKHEACEITGLSVRVSPLELLQHFTDFHEIWYELYVVGHQYTTPYC